MNERYAVTLDRIFLMYKITDYGHDFLSYFSDSELDELGTLIMQNNPGTEGEIIKGWHAVGNDGIEAEITENIPALFEHDTAWADVWKLPDWVQKKCVKWLRDHAFTYDWTYGVTPDVQDMIIDCRLTVAYL